MAFLQYSDFAFLKIEIHFLFNRLVSYCKNRKRLHVQLVPSVKVLLPLHKMLQFCCEVMFANISIEI